MKKWYLIVYSLIFMQVSLFAQKKNSYNPSLSFGFQLAQPLGAFNDYYEGNPVGLSGQLIGPVVGSPIQVGISGAWNSMSIQEEEIMVFIGTDMDGNDIYEEGTMSIKSNNNRYMAVGRFSPLPGAIQIYGDALIGFETYTTKSSIELNDGSNEEPLEKHREHWDATSSVGWAAGVKVKILPSLLIEGRFEKLEGGKTTYVDPESIEVSDQGEFTFTTLETKTNKYTIQVGISLEF